MFPITRMAVVATKCERKGVKLLNKAYKSFGKDTAQEVQQMATEMRNQINKTIKDYSKNPLKRMITWVKSFFDYYKLIKNNIKTETDALKANYGELFTKKRQKLVKTTIIKSIKDDIGGYKDLFKAVKRLKKEFDVVQKAQKQRQKLLNKGA